MKQPDSYSCDVCGIAKGGKGGTNHWRVLRTRDEGAQLQIHDWPGTLVADELDAKHTCGNSCTQKMVERWLQLNTLQAPRAAGGAA